MSQQLKIHTADGTELDLEIAELGSRSYAFVIDWHIRFLLALAWLLLVWVLLMQDMGLQTFIEQLDSSRYGLYILFLPAAALYFLYHPVLEIGMQGRTPGKRMTGVRLVDLKGQTPSVGALLIRNVFRLLDSLPAFYALGCIACLVTRHRVRIGDLASGTLLVYDTTVSNQALERIQRLSTHPSLTPADQELLFDLLERWKAMDSDTRVQLATRFLQKIGEPLPEVKGRRQLNKVLYEQLQQLAAGGT